MRDTRKRNRHVSVWLNDAELDHLRRQAVAAGLGIGAFEPAVFISSKGSTINGQMVEYSESYYPASRSSFQIEIQR